MINDLFMSFFHVLSGYCMCFLWSVCSDLLPTFFPVTSLIFQLWSFLHILAASFPRYKYCRYCLLIYSLLFQFLGGVFGSVNIFNFNMDGVMFYLQSLCLSSNPENFLFSSRSFMFRFCSYLSSALNLFLCTVWVRGQV